MTENSPSEADCAVDLTEIAPVTHFLWSNLKLLPKRASLIIQDP